ncbi:MAG TPA: bifunctional riboflavin kinase/FAD synthetase [Actinomycetota bacterium]|nr:bifunctional riboflavin kinase/FAD synthetase [Actinomycetota bacterium]
MERVHGLAALPIAPDASVVTVGFFDGVHLGHRAALEATVDAARARSLPAVAVTFDRHPREVLTPGREPRLLTTVERKAALIEELGVDVLVVLEFTEEFSRWPPERFMADVLRDGLRARHCVMGANFTFGHRALGTVDTLIREGGRYGFGAERVALRDLEGLTVSSSAVRDAVSRGDVGWARRALGRRFVLDGMVVSGAGRGQGLGYPTANLRTWPRLLLPGQGIYAGRAHVDGRAHAAAIDVGTNPTFGTEPLHVESYLLDFDGDLVGRPMAVEFWAFLRPEVRFESPEELVAAMDEDVERTRSLVDPDTP